jgi:hypothetical protein
MVQWWNTHASLRRLAWWWRRPPVMIPLNSRVPGRAFWPSQSRVDDGGGLQYVSWKTVLSFWVVAMKGIYRRKGNVRGWTRGPHHLVAQPGGGPRHPMVRLPPGCSPSLLWTPSSCQVNRNFLAFVSSNSENISCVTFLKRKNSRKQELTLCHLVNWLIQKYA